MSEFDELLDAVLRRDAAVETPTGMEARIRSALSEETIDPGRRRIWSEAAAASILIGVACGLAFQHFRPAASIAVARRSASVAPAHGLARADVAADPSGVRGGTGAPRGALRVTAEPSGTAGHRISTRRNAPPILPIEVEPLRIKPIEITALTFRSFGTEGETR